jgi:hypothetical protein
MTDAHRELDRALKAHKFDLEIERDAGSDCDLEKRIEATGQLLEWLEQALEPPKAVKLRLAAVAAPDS